MGGKVWVASATVGERDYEVSWTAAAFASAEEAEAWVSEAQRLVSHFWGRYKALRAETLEAAETAFSAAVRSYYSEAPPRSPEKQALMDQACGERNRCRDAVRERLAQEVSASALRLDGGLRLDVFEVHYADALPEYGVDCVPVSAWRE